MAKIEKVFDECIERMMRGESMESCLASHPKEAAELEGLLRTALKVSWKAAEYEPRPGFQDLLRARLEGAHMYAYQRRQQPVKTGGGFSLQRAWVPAMIAVFAVIFSGVGTVAASSYALPDQTLYPVKEATENVRLALAFSDTDKAKVNVKLAETRSEEIAAMANKGDSEQVGILTKKLSTHLQEAQLAISRIEEADTTQEPLSEEQTPPTTPAATTPPDDQQNQEGQQEETQATSQEESTPPEDSTGVETGSEQNDTETTEPEGEQPAVESKAGPSLLPAADTSKKVAALKQEIETNISKNLGILESALNETPEGTKAALQSAIDVSKENYTQIQQGLQNLERLPKYRPGSATNTKYQDHWRNTNQNKTGDNTGSGNETTGTNQQTDTTQEQEQNREQEQQGTGTEAVTDNTTSSAAPEPELIEAENSTPGHAHNNNQQQPVQIKQQQ